MTCISFLSTAPTVFSITHERLSFLFSYVRWLQHLLHCTKIVLSVEDTYGECTPPYCQNNDGSVRRYLDSRLATLSYPRISLRSHLFHRMSSSLAARSTARDASSSQGVLSNIYTTKTSSSLITMTIKGRKVHTEHTRRYLRKQR